MLELTFIQKIAVWAIPVIFAITIHEVAHGWVASFFGDQTARLSGRLTLNPIKHIDPMGTIVVPVLMLLVSNFIFGWAKPVPVNPNQLRHPRRDMAIVALAGPIANLLMAFLWGAIAKTGMLVQAGEEGWWGVPLIYMGGAGIFINIVLGVLNLIPIPPLDGGNILSSLLPPRYGDLLHSLEAYGFLILILLMFSGILTYVMSPLVYFFMGIISQLYGLR